MLTRLDPKIARDEALIEFLDGDFRVIKPGKYVRCAVTGEPILLEDLRYWNVAKQEAYSSRDAALVAIGAKEKR